MKLYILAIILLANVLSIKTSPKPPKPPKIPILPKLPKYIFEYSSAILKVTVEKALQVKTTEEDYIEKISKLDIPQKVKEWVKNLNASKINSKSNIDITYNTTLGGYAKGDSYYFHKTRNEYTFKYGTADVILGPLKTFRRRVCMKKFLVRKCRYETVNPVYNEKKFKSFVIYKINREINSKIYNKYKPPKKNKTKTNKES